MTAVATDLAKPDPKQHTPWVATPINSRIAEQDFLTGCDLMLCVCVCVSKVEGVEARVGRRGHIKVRGGLPVTPTAHPLPSASVTDPMGQGKEAEEDGISVGIQALELRVRNVYTGKCTRQLKACGQISQGCEQFATEFGSLCECMLIVWT